MRRLSRSAAAAVTAILLVLTVCVAAARVVAAGSLAEGDLTEKEKIDALIRTVETSQKSVTFVCERGKYTGRRAAAYMRLKLAMDGKEIATAREFIEFVPAPAVHDSPYEVRFADGSTMGIKDFLSRELLQIETGVTSKEKPQPAPAPTPAPQPEQAAPIKLEPMTEPPFPEVDPEQPPLSEMERRMRSMMNQIKKRLNAYDGWPATRYIRWNHLGQRKHLWDKQGMRDRIEYTAEDGAKQVVVLDLNAKSGIAWENGELITNPESLAEAIGDALDMWVNDSFLMFMPYWLTEPGVHVKYIWMEPLPDDRDAHVYELTFDEGARLAPLPKYRVHAAFDTALIEQWECYEHVDDIAPVRTSPWTDWQVYGSILLSTDRGIIDGKPAFITGVAIYESVPESAFTSPMEPKLPDPVAPNPRIELRSSDVLPLANADAQRQLRLQEPLVNTAPVISP